MSLNKTLGAARHMAQSVSPWEKARTIATLLASVLIPVAVVVITQSYTAAEAARQREAKYLELAIAILREKPREESEAIRTWAIEILGRYSPVPVPQAALDQLRLVPIRDALDGTAKSSADLAKEVEDLTRRWRSIIDLSTLRKGASKSGQ